MLHDQAGAESLNDVGNEHADTRDEEEGSASELVNHHRSTEYCADPVENLEGAIDDSLIGSRGDSNSVEYSSQIVGELPNHSIEE